MQLKEITTTHWGSKHTFTPYLVDKIWGDGEQFIALSPMFIRPLFYVVRIPLGFDLSDLHDIVDEIYDAIEEQFGPCCETYSEYGSCGCDHFESFPTMFDWGGSTWRELYPDEMRKIGLLAKTKKRIAQGVKVE